MSETKNDSGAIVKRKSEFRKFMDVFIKRDAMSLKDDFVQNWLVPQLQYMVMDGVNTFLANMFDVNGVVPIRNGRPVIGKGNTDYNGISTKKAGTVITNGKEIYNTPEIFVPDQAKALDAINKCKRYLTEYPEVPVDKLLDELDITGDFVDTKWGWKNLDSAALRYGTTKDSKGNTINGWWLILPEPEYLGK